MRITGCLLLSLVLLTGCKRHDPAGGTLPVENAAYYWRTTWSLDSVEEAFLRDHDIHRVFCRYFDVVMTDGQPMPNATIHFPAEWSMDNGQWSMDNGQWSMDNGQWSMDNGQWPMELVPTVYITEDCMSHEWEVGNASERYNSTVDDASQRYQTLANRIVSRIVQMNETHDLPPARELQIDCDYTLRSRKTYYDFLSEVRHEAQRHGMALSTTIRLHQLSMPAPPVDYGVLMVYNTGDPQNFAERNPILDIRDVQPYMRYLAGYPLPLAAAYPVYAWQRTLGGVRIEHTVEASEILNAKTMVEKERSDMANTIIIYSLDKENINRYDYETYQKIYRH